MNGCKLATVVLVFTLLLSSIAFFPGQPVEGASSTYKISFNVTDDEYNPVITAQAILEEVHTGSTKTTYTDSSGLASFSQGPGYYMLTITKSGYFDYKYPDIIRFDNISNVNLGIIEMESMPDLNRTLKVYVNETGTSSPVNDVTLQVYDWHKNKLVYEEDSDGYFSIPIYKSWFKFIFTSPGYAKEVIAPFWVWGNMTMNVDMDVSSKIRAYVYIDSAPVTSGLTAYLVSKNDSAIPDARIIEPTVTGTNTFVVDAYDGDFWLLVDANGALANISDLTVNGSKTISVNLNSETDETEVWEVEFYEGDWNYFNITQSFQYNYDRTYDAIKYSYLPSIRMQVDLAFGDGDGYVDQSEANEFKDKLREFGPYYVNTVKFLTINDTAFLSAGSGFTSITVTNLVGPVTSTDGFNGETVTLYGSIGTIDANADDYYGTVKVITGRQYISDAPMDRTCNITFRGGYELVGNETEDPDVAVRGYTTVSIIPDIDMSWGTENVNLEIETSEAPSAIAAIETGQFAYAVTDNDTLLYYIVRENNSINFTAVGSFDPNGNPLKYQWTFGDGDVKNTTSIRYEKTYEQKAYELNAKLTVIDVAELTDEATFKVRVDGLNPIPMIIVDGETIPAGGTVNADQDQPLVFDGSGSVDWINSISDPEHGIIVSWHWDFGDGNSTTVVLAENVTHAYEDAGTFNVTLNVTDAVGHYAVEKITVNVNDTTPPVVQFEVLNSDFVDISEEAPIENETLYFNASKTFDDYFPQDQLTFVWDFGDDTNDTGINVSHSYASIGTFTAKLTVTDPAGNQANETMAITVTSSPRPDLRITSITTDPSRFTEGQSGRIMVNVTNVGNDNATGVKA
ncbi:MAG TPA: PKD domain-containing protein, partial [Methanomassiliicoccales archaeon]|nr:PKD domain-containing protein [Methanomassiliicoccales archaeon]